MDALKIDDLVVLQSDEQAIPMRVVGVQTEGAIVTVTCKVARGGAQKSYRAETLTLYEKDLPVLWRIRTIVSLVGILLGIASCVSAYNFPQLQWLKIFNSAIWAFGPPLWFIVEYCLLVPKWGNPRNKAELQYGQGLASKFWLSVGVLLVAIYK